MDQITLSADLGRYVIGLLFVTSAFIGGRHRFVVVRPRTGCRTKVMQICSSHLMMSLLLLYNTISGGVWLIGKGGTCFL